MFNRFNNKLKGANYVRRKENLKEEDISKVSGGVLSKEAHDWYIRNYLNIIGRTDNIEQEYKVELLYRDLKFRCNETVSIETYKENLKELGIDCGDLI